jgi:outer membrane immunogenic protein
LNTATNAISAGYNFGVNESYVLGLGASYYIGASSSGNGSFTLTAPGAPGLGLPALNATSPVQYQLKNLWAVTLQPGYVIDKNKMVYAKVGYTSVTIGLNSATAPYQTTNLSGYTLGLGYKQMITESIYLLGEANYGGFSNKATTISSSLGTLSSTIGGSGYDFLVGVGYRF